MDKDKTIGLAIVLTILFIWCLPSPSKPPPKPTQQVVADVKPDKQRWLDQAKEHYTKNRQRDWQRLEYKYYPDDNKLSWLVMESSNNGATYFWLDYHYQGGNLTNVTRED
jgi:hypothetical protein